MKQRQKYYGTNKSDGYAYLCKAKETCLPHGLYSMVAQVRIIIVFDDQRDLFERIARVLREEDEALLGEGGVSLH